jgi:succinate dehydrogenase/fumarate reductase flavoprotein subunit
VSIAGRAAVLHARSAPRSGALTTAGQAGLRPAAGKSDVDFDAVIRQVSRELNDYDKNIFREETGLRTSLSILDDLWRTVRYHATGTDRDAVKARETAALVAVDRWVKESALRRRETRGMHWRTDHPEADPAWTHRITVGGLDAVWTRDNPLAKEVA